MKTLIHIGSHKTATTSIQKCLEHHSDELLDSGIYVPLQLGGYVGVNHVMLNAYALDDDRGSPFKTSILKVHAAQLEELRRRVVEDVEAAYASAVSRGCETIIWSNEGLYLLNSVVEYERLSKLFAPYSDDISVICCFREATSFRRSYEQELKKHGIALSRDTSEFSYTQPDSWLFDYDRKKGLLESVFRHRCLYFDYDEEDNVGAFLAIAGIELKDHAGTRYNTRPTLFGKMRIKLSSLLRI